MSRRSYASDDLGSAIGSSYVAIVAVILIIIIYLLVKAVNLIVRVLVTYPKNKAVWIALGIFLVSILLTVLTKADPRSVILAVVSFLGLVFTARIVELYYSTTFQEQSTLVESVLRKPWWQGSQGQKAA
jgi:hypothetical protein